MKKGVLRLFVLILVFVECSTVDKANHSAIHNEHYSQVITEFSDITDTILANRDKMGKDTSSALNDYEAAFIGQVFGLDSRNYSLTGKKVAFLPDKIDYFRQTRERYESRESIVGGSVLYLFNSAQKDASGGYDAAVLYWSYFIYPTERIVRILRKRDE